MGLWPQPHSLFHCFSCKAKSHHWKLEPHYSQVVTKSIFCKLNVHFFFFSFPHIGCWRVLVCPCNSTRCIMSQAAVWKNSWMQSLSVMLRGGMLPVFVTTRHYWKSMWGELNSSGKKAFVLRCSRTFQIWDLPMGTSSHIQQLLGCQDSLSHFLGFDDPQVNWSINKLLIFVFLKLRS